MRSPVAVGIVLGLVVGGGAAAAIAATSRDEGAPATASSAAAPRSMATNATEPAPGSVERLAAAFDIPGSVATDAGGWIVRDGKRLVRVQRTTGLPWFFSSDKPTCVVVPESPSSSQPLPTVPPSGPAECPEDAPPSDVSRDDALALGMDTLTRAGLGASTPVIEEEPSGWYIQADPQIDGRPSGLPWTISIGPRRTITAASGYLAVENP